MHVPDGFIAPQVFVPAYGLVIGLALYGFKRFKENLNERSIPYLATLSAYAFVLSSLSLPLPGGTSVHGMGFAPLSILFGPWIAYLCMCLVLLLQAVLLGHGGITTYSVNALAIGFVGSFCAYGVYSLLTKRKYATFLSGFISTLASALFMSIVLGIHPYLFTDVDGKALYFPYPLSITILLLLTSHIPVAFVEGLLTQAIVSFVRRRGLEG